MAGFLTLLGNMVNQQTFVQTNGAALRGELLQKIMIGTLMLAPTIKCSCLPMLAHNKSSGLGHGLCWNTGPEQLSLSLFEVTISIQPCQLIKR
ncbi:hypothetical protein DPMN_183717 [Dreissena polymorpha]|uniref:Uncharacterized protein n=1 Tax=Dreissena polymorpha TaxID=45954 RepID=A0A9D4DKG0_DREPO|nr:hypothetical protein DPMN_183717 [Dreissena polymorpha]